MIKKHWIRAGILGLIAVAVLVAGIILLHDSEKDQYAEQRDTMSAGFGQLKTVTYGGVTYREKPAITTLLICGIDKPEATQNVTANNYRNGGQADFLMIVAIDHTDKKVHQLQLERDTMAEIDILGIFGNEVGTRTEQLCLAHAFGGTPEDNAKYTIRAVERLLDGAEIDGYYMIDYTAIPTLNDALGGVPVKIEFDMENLNPAWTKGSKVTLKGKEAETFVRARMSVGSGTNEERMVRQNEFMRNAITKMKQRISSDLSFGEQLLDSLQSLSVSNMTSKRLAEEIYKAREYEILEVEHPDGEYTKGKDGFTEFHMKEGAAVQWVLEHLYSRE